MTRKLATLVAALLLPGGLIALFGIWAVEAASHTERGQQWLAHVRGWMPAAQLALPQWQHRLALSFARR